MASIPLFANFKYCYQSKTQIGFHLFKNKKQQNNNLFNNPVNKK